MKRIKFTTLILAACLMVIAYSITAAGQSVDKNQDEEAIKKVITATTDAFNRHDAREFASFYTADAELVTVRGERMKGSAEIEKGLASIFAARAKSAKLKPLAMTIRFIKPDVAVAHVTNLMSGVVNTVGQTQPPHRELSIRVFVKERGSWRVTAFHNTIISAFQPPAINSEK